MMTFSPRSEMTKYKLTLIRIVLRMRVVLIAENGDLGGVRTEEYVMTRPAEMGESIS